jgi:hypothetical protein
MRAAPIPGLRNVERYAEWVEWCEDAASRRAAGPGWYVQFWDDVADVVCYIISAALESV